MLAVGCARSLRVALVIAAAGAWGCSERKAAPPARAAAAPADAGPEVPPLIPGPPPFRAFTTPSGALAYVVREERPRIVGLGEYHERVGAPKAVSAIKRFTTEMLEVLEGGASDLVVETLMAEEGCGKVETKVVTNVKQTTERPATTENEIVTLVTRAKALGVQPHILRVKCAEYQKLLVGRGGKDVDYDALLKLIMRELRDTTTRIIAGRARLAARDGGAPETRLIAIYGGAAHNDITPAEGLEAYSYAAALTDAAGGRYVEIDLYVPELVKGDAELRKQKWYALLSRVGPDRTLLVERGPRSYIVILPTTPAPASAPARAP